MAFLPNTDPLKETEGGYAHSTWGQFMTLGLGNKDIWLGKSTAKKELKKQREIYDALVGKTQALYGSAQADQLKALVARQAGFRSAGNRIGAVQRASNRRLSAEQGAATGADRASAAARGLPSGGVSRSASADSGRVREVLATSLAALRANLARGEGAAAVESHNEIASLQENFQRQQAQIEIDRMEAYRAVVRGRSGGLLKPVLTIVGSIWGAGAAGSAIGGAAESNIS